MSSPITTHILDTARGRPAAGVPVTLQRLDGEEWVELGAGKTDDDGRNRGLLAKESMQAGTWKIRFDTGAYFKDQATQGFYPFVEIVFTVTAADEHYHVPLLLNPYGYSTYRGS